MMVLMVSFEHLRVSPSSLAGRGADFGTGWFASNPEGKTDVAASMTYEA